MSGDPAHLDGVHLTATFLGTFIGAVTLTGSAVAFGKLHGILGEQQSGWGGDPATAFG